MEKIVEESDEITEIRYENEKSKTKDDFPTRNLILLGLAIICALLFQNYWQNRNDILLTQDQISKFQTQVETMLASMGDNLTQRYAPDFKDLKQSVQTLSKDLSERNRLTEERYKQIEHKAREFFADFNILNENRQNEEKELELLRSGHYSTHFHSLDQTLHHLHLQNSKIRGYLFKELSENLPEFVTVDEFAEKKAKYQYMKEAHNPVTKEEVDKRVSEYVRDLLRNPKFIAKITDYYLDEIYRNVHSPLRGDVKQLLSNKDELRRKIQLIIEQEIENRLFKLQ